MLAVELIVVGKIKEAYLRDAINEYSKRLSRYCNLTITEIQEFGDDHLSVAKEGSLILPKLSGVCVPLCVEGKQKSSEELAEWIGRQCVEGQSKITFVIGGSRGLEEQVKARGACRLSFSKMTFPHQLMRVILLEQLYRAFKILAGESYHK